MKNLIRIVLGLGLSTASILSAQTTSTSDSGPRRGPGGRGGPRGGHPVVRAIDTDKNHELSATEIASASASLLTLDANQDGSVSAEELQPARPSDAPDRPGRDRSADARKGGPRARPVSPVMLALDANSDGALSAAEITNAAASLRALDANSDGKLTPDELRPLPPAQN